MFFVCIQELRSHTSGVVVVFVNTDTVTQSEIKELFQAYKTHGQVLRWKTLKMKSVFYQRQQK